MPNIQYPTAIPSASHRTGAISLRTRSPHFGVISDPNIMIAAIIGTPEFQKPSLLDKLWAGYVDLTVNRGQKVLNKIKEGFKAYSDVKIAQQEKLTAKAILTGRNELKSNITQFVQEKFREGSEAPLIKILDNLKELQLNPKLRKKELQEISEWYLELYSFLSNYINYEKDRSFLNPPTLLQIFMSMVNAKFSLTEPDEKTLTHKVLFQET
jgi:hypothetical protein